MNPDEKVNKNEEEFIISELNSIKDTFSKNISLLADNNIELVKLIVSQKNELAKEMNQQLVKGVTDLANFIAQKNHQEYIQIEALFSIYSVLDLRYPMPPMRGWPISPDFGNLVMKQILDQDLNPNLLFELGSGVSSVLSGYCFEKRGKGSVLSIDHDASFSQLSQKMLKNHGLQNYVKIHHTPLVKTKLKGNEFLWYDLKILEPVEPIDILVIDGPPGYQQKMARYPAVPLLHKYLRDGAVILVDDANRPDEQEMVKRWLSEYKDLSAEEVKTEKGAVILRKKAA